MSVALHTGMLSAKMHAGAAVLSGRLGALGETTSFQGEAVVKARRLRHGSTASGLGGNVPIASTPVAPRIQHCARYERRGPRDSGGSAGLELEMRAGRICARLRQLDLPRAFGCAVVPVRGPASARPARWRHRSAGFRLSPGGGGLQV